jgi:chromosome segregation ATPase
MKHDGGLSIMTKISIFGLFTVAVTALLIASPFDAQARDKTPLEEVKKETKELIEALKTYTAEQREEAVEKTKSALDKLDRRIDSLENRVDKDWDKMDRAARQNARESLRTLRRQRTRAAEWYGGFRNSSAEAWGHMKKGFSDAYRSLSEAWQKSEKEFGSGSGPETN